MVRIFTEFRPGNCAWAEGQKARGRRLAHKNQQLDQTCRDQPKPKG